MLNITAVLIPFYSYLDFEKGIFIAKHLIGGNEEMDAA